MSLGLATRGYICPPVAQPPDDVTIGPGPDVTSVDELTPVVDRARELSPRIERGEGLVPEIISVGEED
jgi:hypothetical protein